MFRRAITSEDLFFFLSSSVPLQVVLFLSALQSWNAKEGEFLVASQQLGGIEWPVCSSKCIWRCHLRTAMAHRNGILLERFAAALRNGRRQRIGWDSSAGSSTGAHEALDTMRSPNESFS